jgi:hypothetical protein
MSVICLKLSSGEELIARQQETLDNSLLLKDVHVLVVQPTPKGMDVTFVPWAFGAGRAAIVINRDHVTSIYEPGTDLEKGFLGQVSGIQLAGV